MFILYAHAMQVPALEGWMNFRAVLQCEQGGGSRQMQFPKDGVGTEGRKRTV